MARLARLSRWLEQRWVAPAYIGWVLLGLAVFFFAAATNTLAGWLYVMSGVIMGLLVVAVILPPRNLQGLEVQRSGIAPVSVGQPIMVNLTVKNSRGRSKGLFQLIDQIPSPLGDAPTHAISAIGPGQVQDWHYRLITQQRGIYRWAGVYLRSAAPLGLFWCRRWAAAPAEAVVYPHILPLQRCPMIDTLGQASGLHWPQSPRVQPATEGVTRALRPYRWGDPTRLIHWRTSARYGELRVRELEKVIAGQEVILALNTAARWSPDHFEQAVVAAASLYVYSLNRGLAAALWLPHQTLLRDYHRVLMALAEVHPLATADAADWPDQAVVWLTPLEATHQLVAGSQQVVWGQASTAPHGRVLWIDSQAALQPQLQILP
ncbi:DUF58 domain-containing protein [Nodosilinea sp. P-1105]|uniref:DUF58 domain-containing protein n=1 Tax=Nodosilinea sp. P-1105 TaxID=2546229 RepID=UPI001469C1E0|nr:DUF58 domain-containing protein [Nodosilinea sp. P-1105]NMF84397.1 DUF58 domain-containing protein [Nodosilinea sp. P-1105]